MFKQRLLSALIGIPVVLLAVRAGGTVFFLVILIVAVLALRELFLLCGIADKGVTRLGYLGSILVITITYYYGLNGLIAALIASFLLLNIYWVFIFPSVFQPIMITLWGLIYIAGLISFFLLLREMPDGFMHVISVFLTIWASDSGAYLCGITWGKHKLVPAVSPKKSVEGALGGLLFAGVIFALMAPSLNLTYSSGILIGILLSFVGQLGDLTESALKRWSNTKDSGRFLPGHGGLLDRLDSLLFAAPVAYFVYSLLSRGVF